MGGAPAAAEHERIHVVFWAFGEAAVGRIALSVVLFCGTGALELFRYRAFFSNECGGGEPACHHASVFSAADFAACQRVVGPGGFCDCFSGAGCNGCRVWIAPGPAGTVAATFVAAGARHGAGGRAVAFRAQCAISRRKICDSIRDAVLAAGFAGGVPQQPGSGEVAMAVRLESDGWGDRRVPLGTDGTWPAARRAAAGVGERRGGAAGERDDVLPEDGRSSGGPGVTV